MIRIHNRYETIYNTTRISIMDDYFTIAALNRFDRANHNSFRSTSRRQVGNGKDVFSLLLQQLWSLVG